MSAQLNFTAIDRELAGLRNWGTPLIEARSAEKRLLETQVARFDALFKIRQQLKAMPGGLTMSELTDFVVALSVAANPSLEGPIGALKDMAVDFDGAAFYGVDSVEWTK